jgi:hypothetical protein
MKPEPQVNGGFITEYEMIIWRECLNRYTTQPIAVIYGG